MVVQVCPGLPFVGKRETWKRPPASRATGCSRSELPRQQKRKEHPGQKGRLHAAAEEQEHAAVGQQQERYQENHVGPELEDELAAGEEVVCEAHQVGVVHQDHMAVHEVHQHEEQEVESADHNELPVQQVAGREGDGATAAPELASPSTAWGRQRATGASSRHGWPTKPKKPPNPKNARAAPRASHASRGETT